MTDLSKYTEVQANAKSVLSEIAHTLKSTDTERSIATRAIKLLIDRGITETWYHNCPAFVLLGSRSCLSISGRDYDPSAETVGETNLVTIDLSPKVDGIWGDCARSFAIEGGCYQSNPRSGQFLDGFAAEQKLHDSMKAYVTPTTTFDELYRFGNSKIESMGYENLDFASNLGHSIVKSMDERSFIEKGNNNCLGHVPFFTFEPHVRPVNGQWGFKHEDVFYFDSNGELQVL